MLGMGESDDEVLQTLKGRNTIYVISIAIAKDST